MALSEIRKTIINMATLVVSIGSLILGFPGIHLLPAPMSVTISLVVAVAGAVVHYLTPNVTNDPHVAATQSVRLRKAPA
jgi:hypothetical protein